jgi:hypothetical protein
MNKIEIKNTISNKLITLMRDWFPDKPLIQAVGITIIQTNVNKFDGLLDMLTMDDGTINIDALVENLGPILEQDYTMDLTTISPLLPKRVLIISKEDIKGLINEIKGLK